MLKLLELYHEQAFKEASFRLRENLDFIKKCIKLNPSVIIYISEELQENRALIPLAIQTDPSILK